MTAAFLFLLTRSLKNRVSARFKRLRDPRYLVSALVGIAYLYFAFLHPSFVRRPRMLPPPLATDPAVREFMELLFACILAAVVTFQYFFSNVRTPLFNAAEVQFLFAAPVSRGALLNYRIAKAQTGILFGSLISLLILGRGRLFPNVIFLLITVWGVYLLLFLYRIALTVSRQDPGQREGRSRRLRSWIAWGIPIAAIMLTVSARWFYPSPPSGSRLTAHSFFAWLKTITASGPVYCVLLPFRLFVRPAFAGSTAGFLWHSVPLLLAITGLYAGVRRTAGGFEPSVLGQNTMEGIAGSVPGLAAPRQSPRKPRRPPFRLEAHGWAPVGIYWKNLSLARGLSIRQVMPGLAVLATMAILLAGASGEQVALMIGSVCAGMAGFLTLMGPILLRDDLRTDLKNIDVLKTYPVPGWGIVLGEILGPATVLTIVQLALLVLAVFMLPGIGKTPWTILQRFYLGAGAALLLPCLGFIGILVQNAAVLILPGWTHLGREHQRGVEAMGQRLISSLATILSLLVAALPAALLFLVTSVSGYWLIGLAIVPVASLVAAMGLLAEGAVGIFWLGRLFDRFDASKEIG